MTYNTLINRILGHTQLTGEMFHVSVISFPLGNFSVVKSTLHHKR